MYKVGRSHTTSFKVGPKAGSRTSKTPLELRKHKAAKTVAARRAKNKAAKISRRINRHK